MAPFTIKIQKNIFFLGPFIEDLPENVMVDILSRLPVKTIIHCKCVCSKWRNIVSDSYFANLHLLRSPAGLVIHDRSIYDYPKPGILKWVEVEEELDHHHLHHDPVMSLDLNLAPVFQRSLLHPVGSVNGLICLRKFGRESDNTYICNPITREYMILPKSRLHRDNNATTVYGFGVGSLTREYKVIRIFQWDGLRRRPTSTSEAEVYTLGSGQWRSLGHVPYWPKDTCGLFLNGHAHWTVGDRERICAFDFDTETFDWFPSPPSETFIIEISQLDLQCLLVVKGCLSRCDAVDSEFVIWVMKEYGIKESWHKEVVIKPSMIPDINWSTWNDMELLEILKDGTILMVFYQTELMAYCPRKKTFVDIEMFDSDISGICYRPSFLKLQNLESERVHVF